MGLKPLCPVCQRRERETLESEWPSCFRPLGTRVVEREELLHL